MKESGVCFPEQQDAEFPALGEDIRVSLVDVGAAGSDIISDTDDSNAETDTTSASDADIASHDADDESDTQAASEDSASADNAD